jgi:hypothetical protein
MATISPNTDGPISTANVVNWTAVSTGDTINSYAIPEEFGAIGCVQITGTFGGASVTMEVSNDGTTWFGLTDLQGTPVTATANTFADFSTAAIYMRPAITGGSSDSVNVRVAFRGWRG